MARVLQTTVLASLAIFVLTLAPLSVTGATGVNLTASVQCEDCQNSPEICCGECTHPTQQDKCTCGEPWCDCGSGN